LYLFVAMLRALRCRGELPMASINDFPDTRPEKLTGEERRALLLCAGGVGGAFGLVVFLSRYLYLLG